MRSFNSFNNAHNNSYNDLLSSNTKFDNITATGTLASHPFEYTSITTYDDVIHYVMKDGYDMFAIPVDDDIVYIKYQDGKYSYYSYTTKHNHEHDNPLPLLTRNDVSINNDGTLLLSDKYMKSFYIALVNSDIDSTLNFGDLSLSYSGILDYFGIAKFTTTVTWNGNTMSNYEIVLKAGESVYYSLAFTTSDAQTVVDLTMHQRLTSHFVYVKGDNAYATLDAVWDNATPKDYHARVDIIDDLPDFVYNDALNAEIANAINRIEMDKQLQTKYSGQFTCTSDCNYVFVYDNQYNVYVVLAKINTNQYMLIDISMIEYTPDVNACLGTIDLDSKTLTVVEHCNKEKNDRLIADKYVGIYTIEPTGNYDGAIIYDSEYDVYVIFVYLGRGFEYYGHAKIEDPSMLEGMPVASRIDTVTKVIYFN